jgi:putative addiction module killer protein
VAASGSILTIALAKYGYACVTIEVVRDVEILEYLDPAGRSPFALWFAGLNAVAAARVTVALTRLGNGNFSNVEGVGAGVYEYKVDFGPGYRIYFGKDGERIVILLGGSAKKRQSAAIAAAQRAWAAYKRAKAGKGGEKWH